MSHQNNDFKPINSCQNNTLAYYQQKIRFQQTLLQRIKTVLPLSVSEQFVQCVIAKPALLIYLKPGTQQQPNWSIFQQPILESIAGFVELNRIEFRQYQDIAHTAPPPLKLKPPPKQLVQEIRCSAMRKPDDELNQALLRLSLTLEKLHSATD